MAVRSIRERAEGACQVLIRSLVNRIEEFLFRPALRADPVIGQVGKGSACLNLVFVIAFGRVIDVATGAFHFLHSVSPGSRWKRRALLIPGAIMVLLHNIPITNEYCSHSSLWLQEKAESKDRPLKKGGKVSRWSG